MSESDFSAFWQLMEDCLLCFAYETGWGIESLSSSSTARSVFERFVLTTDTTNAKNICAHMTLLVLDLMDECTFSLEGELVVNW